MKAVVSLFAMALIAGASSAAMADDVAGAAKAFSKAQRAMLAGEYSQAADLFELADSLAGSPAALRSAARSRYAAGHLAAAATHAAELLRRYPGDQESRAFAEELLDKLGSRLARVSVECSAPCAIEVDAQAVATGTRTEHRFFVRPGRAEIVAIFADRSRGSRTIDVVAGKAAAVEIEEPPDPEPAAVTRRTTTASQTPARSGIRKRWVIGATVATAALGAGAALFGVSTLRDRDRIREEVAAGNIGEAEALYDSAETKELMTNVFIAGAVVAGATAVTLAFVTDWSGDREVGVAPTDGGAAISFAGRF